jgi:hypothetical protein
MACGSRLLRVPYLTPMVSIDPAGDCCIHSVALKAQRCGRPAQASIPARWHFTNAVDDRRRASKCVTVTGLYWCQTPLRRGGACVP